MKAVLIGESSGASMEAIMAVYPRHKAVVEEFKARGEVIGIGPFADRGNMGIFRTREAAEAFAKEDPFILRKKRSTRRNEATEERTEKTITGRKAGRTPRSVRAPLLRCSV